MDNDDKGLGIGSTGSNLSKAFKEGTLFSKPDTIVGGTGYAPNADQMKPVDDTDDLQKIAEGADPDAVKKASEEDLATVIGKAAAKKVRSYFNGIPLQEEA